jgi:hypothetical protein
MSRRWTTRRNRSASRRFDRTILGNARIYESKGPFPNLFRRVMSDFTLLGIGETMVRISTPKQVPATKIEVSE